MLSPTDIRSIEACVHDLEYTLNNWKFFADCCDSERVTLDAGDTTRGIFDVDMGLCDNLFRPNKLPEHIKMCMFIAWDGFSGDVIYPVCDEDEYEGCDGDNLYQNQDRKALALHCVDYLKYLLELLS